MDSQKILIVYDFDDIIVDGGEKVDARKLINHTS